MTQFIYSQVEVSLKGVPMHLKEAIYSLGGSKLASSYILLRYVKASILAGAAIGVGKAMGETAPLLFTAFGSDHYPVGGFEALLKPVGALTLAIYNMALSGYSNWVEASWGAAFILLSISIVLFTAMRIITRSG
jgi:phosphate transport system permease protein